MKHIGTLFTLALATVVACGDEDGDGGGNGASRGIVNGRVLATNGDRVAEATVRGAGRTATTNESGFFVLSDLAPGRTQMNVAAEGYARGGQAVTVVAGQTTYVELRILRFDAETDFDPAVGGAVQAGAARVEFPQGAVDGSGTVTARLAVLDATNANELSAFPGDFSTNAGGLLESFGAVAVEVSDASGNPLDLNESASVSLPVSAAGEDTIPLWSFDESTGRWVQEGELTGCADGTCEGTLPFLGWWNADQVMETSCVNVCVEDGDGAASAGIAVQAQGINYNGISYATTGVDGCACVDVRREGRVGIVGFSSSLITTPVEVTAPAATAACGDPGCLELDAPLVVTAPEFQATLEWGEQPTDLDSHFTGPCDPADTTCTDRFHVYYSSQGSLSSPPWALLDTDDTSSFGPEVVTLARCFAGTYRYSVHNFSGAPALTESGARVTILLPSGSLEIANVPTSGATEADDVWIVGDLTCSNGSGCACTWSTVNQFASESDGYDP